MTATTSIPLSPADVTADWLSSVLSNISRPVVVTDVEVTPIGTGQTGATYRVSATYAGDHYGLPDTFVVKLPSQEADVLPARAASICGRSGATIVVFTAIKLEIGLAASIFA